MATNQKEQEEKDLLVFDLRRQEKKLKITKLDGTAANWTLREIDGSQRVLYMNMMGTKMKTDADGKAVGIKDYTGVETNLIAMCLFDEKGESVGEAEIKKFPSQVQSNLYLACMKLCGLMDAAKDEVKNV